MTSEVAAQANALATEASVKFGVYGTINEVTGGFAFGGVLKNDGTVGYYMEFLVDTFLLKDPGLGPNAPPKTVFQYFAGQFIFTGDVVIYGNLHVVDGTIITDKVDANAITQSLAILAMTLLALPCICALVLGLRYCVIRWVPFTIGATTVGLFSVSVTWRWGH